MRRIRGVVALAAVTAGCLVGTAHADASADEIGELRAELRAVRARQAQLESEVAELRAGAAPQGTQAPQPGLTQAVREVLASLPPEDRATGAGGVRRAARDIEFGGYFSTRYVSSQLPGEHSSFVDMRLVPKLHAQISEGISFDTEVELEHAGIGGPAEDGEVIVEMAELTAEFDPAFALQAGTLLVPFGHFNLNHDDPINELSSRPRVARYVVPSAFGLPGVGAKGTVEVEDTGVFTYKVAVTNGFRDEFTEDGARGTRGLFEEDDNHDKTVFARAAFSPSHPPIDALSVGVSGARGRLGSNGRGEHRLTGWGVDVQAKHGPWEFLGEMDRFGIDRASGSAPAVLAGGAPGPVRGLSGWYAQLLHRIENDWVRSLPFATDNASLGVLLRYDTVDLHDRIRGASPQDDERALSFGVTYRPSARTAVKLEYRHADSPFEGPEGSERDFFALEFATYF